jgi:hypothetical protein
MEEVRTVIAPDVEAKVRFYHDVAKANGSVISLSELISLMPEKASEVELVSAIESTPSLNSRFEISSGYVVERMGESEAGSTLRENSRGRSVAMSNMRSAIDFANLLHTIRFKMVSVSGSTSYSSASRSRDLDLFCIAPSDGLWLSLTQGLIMARVFALLRRRVPQICFSCVMDEAYAQSLFGTPQDALFARDALETKVIRGKATYDSLLQQAAWISRLYPTRRSAFGKPNERILGSKSKPYPFKRILNRFLFLTVGGYIKAKSHLYNKKFISLGQRGRVFTIRSAEDHLIYESNRYLELRRGYELAFSDSEHARE